MTKILLLNNINNLLLVSNNCKQIFIYGTLVDDFHKLDYNSIFTLNVAATQELYKEHVQLKEDHLQLKEYHLQLKEEHLQLKENFNILLNKYNNIEKRLSCLKI
jgi:predicted nuclease with TOPRIM domain